MSALKSLAHDWLPPAVVRWVGLIRGRNGIHFDGAFATWEAAEAQCAGYSAQNILAKVLVAALEVKRGSAAFERDSVLFDEIEYEWPVLAGLMCAAARNAGRLDVLDFGGALGSCYFQNRKFLQTLPKVRWNVVEQPHYVDAGRMHMQNDQLRFYPTIEECLTDNQPNLVLLSGVLQYLPAPVSVLLDLIEVDADAIVIDRTIVNRSSLDRIYVQHVPPSIYSASYPCRSLSESGLLAALGSRYLSLADFPSLNFPALKSIDSEFRGYVFLKHSE